MESKYKSLGHLMICEGITCRDGGALKFSKRIKQAWIKHRLFPAFYLSFAECLGPCDLPCNACINTPVGSIYLGNLAEEQFEELISWALLCKEKGEVGEVPLSLKSHLVDRFLR